MTQNPAFRRRRVTVFGGTGFIGRHLVRRLAKGGARIRAVTSDPERAMSLKPLGDPGQIVAQRGDLRDPATVAAAIAGAEMVVNLVGILYPRGGAGFAAIHVEGARHVAEAAREAGARRLVHVSALGADPRSPSEYARSKAAGEVAVRAAFPGATVIRPSVVFGRDDQFFNRFAELARFSPVLPLIGGGKTRFQPVYVGDVAEAIQRVLADPTTAGETYELGGPQVFTLRELFKIVLQATGRSRLLVPLPFWLAGFEARFLEWWPKPPLTRDQVKLLTRDSVVGRKARGLADLGIAPTAVAAVVPAYLARYRRPGGATVMISS